jgi:hypothetical protein
LLSQSRIEMDSSAIYVNASSDLIAEGDLRWQLAAHERRVFLTDLLPDMMKWKWCDFATGETLAPAFDEPPELPELSRWMPTEDSKITWDRDDLQVPGGEVDETDLLDTKWTAGTTDCVLMYQYA